MPDPFSPINNPRPVIEPVIEQPAQELSVFSQHGEDLFLFTHAEGLTPTFLDIGAYDGITFSNSRYFRNFNWRLILVEANEEALEKAKELYKGDDKVSGFWEFIVPIRNQWGYLEYEADKWGLANVKTHNKETTKYTKRCITLSEFCGSLGLKERDDIGILSIDIEGTELKVLQQFFKNSKVRPQMICVEGNTPEAKQALRDFLSTEYEEIGELNVNLIFKRKDLIK